MIHKRFTAIVLAVGLFLSIGYAVSQQHVVLLENQTLAYTVTPIESYYVFQKTLTASEEATIVCVLISGGRVAVNFLKDGAPIRQNFLPETGWSNLYYPYSRYNDVLAILETGDAEFGRETGEGARPESAAIQLAMQSG